MKVPFTMFYPGLGCDPTEEEFIAGFIMDVAKAIADWYKGINVSKKLYKLLLNNSIALFLPI